MPYMPSVSETNACPNDRQLDFSRSALPTCLTPPSSSFPLRPGSPADRSFATSSTRLGARRRLAHHALRGEGGAVGVDDNPPPNQRRAETGREASTTSGSRKDAGAPVLISWASVDEARPDPSADAARSAPWLSRAR